MVVSDYILLTLFFKFHNLAQLHCDFCPICSCPSRIGQTVEKSNHSQPILVADHHPWSPCMCLFKHFLASSFQRHVDSEPAHFQHQVGREGKGSPRRVYALHPQQEGQEVLRGHVHHSRRNILLMSDEVNNVYLYLYGKMTISKFGLSSSDSTRTLWTRTSAPCASTLPAPPAPSSSRPPSTTTTPGGGASSSSSTPTSRHSPRTTSASTRATESSTSPPPASSSSSPGTSSSTSPCTTSRRGCSSWSPGSASSFPRKLSREGWRSS